jgi:hypothetical protein
MPPANALQFTEVATTLKFEQCIKYSVYSLEQASLLCKNLDATHSTVLSPELKELTHVLHKIFCTFDVLYIIYVAAESVD